MRFTIVGPGEQELTDLKTGWVNWLRDNKTRVRDLRRELKRRIDEFSNGTPGSPFDLGGWNGIPDFKHVTAPNVASLMFMVEEDGKRLLLTGDSQQEKILTGLQQTGFLGNQGLHVDVLKVQHHGSEHNMDPHFARQVSADHYVFCGNGLNGNPNPEVIDFVFNSRRGAPRRAGAGADRQRSAVSLLVQHDVGGAGSGRADADDAFKALEDHVEQLRQSSQGQLVLHFNQAASIELKIQ